MTLHGDPVDVLSTLHTLGARVRLDRGNELNLVDAGSVAPDFVTELFVSNRSLLAAVLAAERLGHVWKRCDHCREGTITNAGSTPPCRMTPGCPGRHGGDGSPRPSPRRATSNGDPRPAHEGDVVYLVRCDSGHDSVYTRNPCRRCRIIRTVRLGVAGSLPPPRIT